MTVHIPKQSRFNNYSVDSLYRVMVTETSVVGVMKMGKSVPRAENKPISLALQARMLTITPNSLPDVTILPTPTYLYSFLPDGSVQATLNMIILIRVPKLSLPRVSENFEEAIDN